MGGSPSKKELQAQLDREDFAFKDEDAKTEKALIDVDERTRVPHLLVEIRSLGFVALQGKDTGETYRQLDKFLQGKWRVQRCGKVLLPECKDDEDCCCRGYSYRFDLRPMPDHHRLNAKTYTLGTLRKSYEVEPNGVYQFRDKDGECNMGKLTMEMIQFMTDECGWMFQTCSPATIGWKGDIREQHMQFRAPHPSNTLAPHLMIELRQAGFVEVNGPNTDGIHGTLEGFLVGRWESQKQPADHKFCTVRYKTPAFKSRGAEGESNMGQRTLQLVDFMVKECAWTMVSCNSGNFGRTGTRREQQLVFRRDEVVQHGLDHIIIEFRTTGSIEIIGLNDAQDLQPHLAGFLTGEWGCTEEQPEVAENDSFFDLKYTVPEELFTNDVLTTNLCRRAAQLAGFLGQHGWALSQCNGTSLTPQPRERPGHVIREQQLKFVRAETAQKAEAPIVIVELRTQPDGDDPPTWEGFVQISGPNTKRDENSTGVYEHLDEFLKKRMRAELLGVDPVDLRLGRKVEPADMGYCDRSYTTKKFRLARSHAEEKGRVAGLMNGESDIAKWAIRIIDYMVDHLAEWDLVACSANNLSRPFGPENRISSSVAAREMQIVFRQRAQGRVVFRPSVALQALGRPPLHPPDYWTNEGCRTGLLTHEMVPGTPEELGWMQDVLDRTYELKPANGRNYGQPSADRLVAVRCIRSEHPALWDRFAERRLAVVDNARRRVRGADDFNVTPRTMYCSGMSQLIGSSSMENPSNQAFLLRGTEPTTAVNMLMQSFAADPENSLRTEFGPGFYLVESSTKADEYARDDIGGEYKGLYAMVVCRAVLGRSLITQTAGDFKLRVTCGEYDHVLWGDRDGRPGQFREFVFYHEEAIYPEYVVFYRREKGGQVMMPRRPVSVPGMAAAPGMAVAPDMHRMEL